MKHIFWRRGGKLGISIANLGAPYAHYLRSPTLCALAHPLIDPLSLPHLTLFYPLEFSLTSKAKLFATAARALLVWRQDPALTEAADKALHSLAMADGGEAGGKSGAGGEPSMGSSTGLSMEAAAFVGRYAAQLAESARSEYELDVMWDNQAPDHIVLVQLLEIVPVPQRLALPQPDDPVELEAEAGAGSQGEDNIPSPPSPSSREAATPTPAMAKRRAHALAQDAARIQAAAEALGALVGQVADLLAEAGKPLGQGGIADEMTPDQVGAVDSGPLAIVGHWR